MYKTPFGLLSLVINLSNVLYLCLVAFAETQHITKPSFPSKKPNLTI